MENIFKFETGDLLLFSNKSILSKIIEWSTWSKYSHVGIVLKDPTYIKEDLEGYFIMESTGLTDIKDSENNQLKFGVQIRPLVPVIKEYDGAVYWRRLNANRNDDFYYNIKLAHEVLHGKPYDLEPEDWIKAFFDITSGNTRYIKEFFCSAMVTFMYCYLDLVQKDVHWTIIRPRDMGTEYGDSRLVFKNCSLEPEVMLKDYPTFVEWVYSWFW